MPIKKRYERSPRMPLAGTIHLGIIKTNAGGKQYPAATDYFVVTERDNTPGRAVEAFRAVYGEQPKEIDIMFPVADRLQYADRNYEAWTRGHGRVCKGDGEKAMAKWDASHDGPRPIDADGVDVLEAGTWISEAQLKKEEKPAWQMREIPCFGDECPMAKAKKCKPITHLMFFMPKIKLVGVWRISFGSEHGHNNIEDHLYMLERLFGQAHGIPLKLRLRPIQVTPQGERTKTVMVLDIAPLEEYLAQVAAGVERLPKDRLLAAPEQVDGDDPWLFAKYGVVDKDAETDGDPPDDLEEAEIEHAATEPIEGVARDVTNEAPPDDLPPDDLPPDDLPPETPVEAPAPDSEELARNRFWARQGERKLDHRLTCLYLGLPKQDKGAVTEHWIGPCIAKGLTAAEAYDLADIVVGQVLKQAKDAKEKQAPNDRASVLGIALGIVLPGTYIERAAAEKAAKA